MSLQVSHRVLVPMENLIRGRNLCRNNSTYGVHYTDTSLCRHGCVPLIPLTTSSKYQRCIATTVSLVWKTPTSAAKPNACNAVEPIAGSAREARYVGVCCQNFPSRAKRCCRKRPFSFTNDQGSHTRFCFRICGTGLASDIACWPLTSAALTNAYFGPSLMDRTAAALALSSSAA